MHYRLIMFDLDDTLVASRTWVPAETMLYARLGSPYRPDIAATYKGMNAWDVARTMHARLQPPDSSAEECGRLLRGYLLECAHLPTAPMPGADALVRALAGRATLAVASGSPLEVIRHMLHRFGWGDAFSLLVSSEEVPRGKPAPDVFLETLRRAGCPPAEALVIEDSLAGVRAARAAGVACFVAPSSDDPRIAAEADRAFPSLAEMLPVLCRDGAHDI